MKNQKGQAIPNKTQPIPTKAFNKQEGTTLYWLGNSGLLINGRGTTILVDPVLEGFDIPLLIDMPLNAAEIPQLDAVLLTHSDNDHFSVPTLTKLKRLKPAVHGPKYVAELFTEKIGGPASGHDLHDHFKVNNIEVEVTPADHAWQNDTTKFDRVFQFEDFCGFYLKTIDGSLFIPGDSRLLPEQLTLPEPDAILFDFSDNSWHIGFENAVKLANTYSHADLLLSHWGTVDAFDKDVFNGNPDDLFPVVTNPERIRVLAAGEAFSLVSHQ
ncbi:MBL fold metallo-hydrolase [Enterococcus sp. LJL90]